MQHTKEAKYTKTWITCDVCNECTEYSGAIPFSTQQVIVRNVDDFGHYNNGMKISELIELIENETGATVETTGPHVTPEVAVVSITFSSGLVVKLTGRGDTAFIWAVTDKCGNDIRIDID